MANVLISEEKETHLFSDNQIITRIEVSAKTPTVDNAGTDANVTLNIGGIPYALSNSDDNFEQGHTDKFFLETYLTLGQLRRSPIELYHDNTGDKPGWYVGDFSLEIQFQDYNVFSLYKRWGAIQWLAIDEPNGNFVILQHGDAIIPIPE